VYHVRRRLSEIEQDEYGIPCARDIRGSTEETDRLVMLLDEAPHLAQFFPHAALAAVTSSSSLTERDQQ
jgi:hypothetical protein